MMPLVLSGARVTLSLNGSTFAAGYVLNYDIQAPVDDIEGLDNVFEEELAPRRVKVSLSLQVFRTPQNDPDLLGIGFNAAGMNAASSGSSANAGNSQAPASNPGVVGLSQRPYITVQAQDRVTGLIVLFLPRAMLVGRSGGVQAEDLLSETWSVRGIGYAGPQQQTSALLPAISGLANAL